MSTDPVRGTSMSTVTATSPQVALNDITDRIRTGLRRTGTSIIAVGQDLLAAKELLGHGQFGTWLDTEFALSQRSAERFMAAARRFGDRSDTVSNLPPGVVHELSAPGTPDEIVDRVVAGDLPPTVDAVRTAARSGRRHRRGSRAARGLMDELWDLPDQVEEAAEAVAQEVLKQDDDFARWVSETFEMAAYLIAERRAEE